MTSKQFLNCYFLWYWRMVYPCLKTCINGFVVFKISWSISQLCPLYSFGSCWFTTLICIFSSKIFIPFFSVFSVSLLWLSFVSSCAHLLWKHFFFFLNSALLPLLLENILSCLQGTLGTLSSGVVSSSPTYTICYRSFYVLCVLVCCM